MADFCLSAAENLKKVKHLLDLPKASTNLTLLKADLTEEGNFDEAIHGCHGVFHVATPMDFESKDPESPDGCTVASAAGDELRFWNVFGTPEVAKPAPKASSEPFAHLNRIR